MREGRKLKGEIRREKGGRQAKLCEGMDPEGGQQTKLAVQQRTTSTTLNIHNNTQHDRPHTNTRICWQAGKTPYHYEGGNVF